MGAQLPSEPITRKEQYLAKAAGQAVEIPAEPITREEAYLDAIAKGSGGGGGTSDYSQLTNKPQVNGNTLIGNKSASDLGLVAAVEGKGLSTNDYTDADATIVAGVTTALSGKQDKLTAGEYIDITSGEISVDRVIPNESASYELKTTSTSDPNIVTQVIKTSNGSVVWTRDYNYADVRDNPVTIDNMIILSYTGSKWKYELLVASDDHSVGYYQEWSWSAWIDYTEDFSTIDNTGKKLIIKSEMDTALASKADASDVKNEFLGTLDEWNALTVEQRKAYDTYQIKGDYTEGSGGLPDYSTTEQLTGQKWIDGKDIYFKTYTNIRLTSGTVAVVDSNFGSSNNVVDIKCVISGISSGIRHQYITTAYNEGGNFSVFPEMNGDSLQIVVRGDWSNYSANIVIYYTKTN